MSKRKSRSRSRKTVPDRRFDAFPDRIDIRDWPYRPTLDPLPEEIVNCHAVPAVLDQGSEGACTGFALAAVINFLHADRGQRRRVSPRMLYEMARCYDEWPGENYEGSSARGAMKGWSRHGVCAVRAWPNDWNDRTHLNGAIAQDALESPCGAYYRVDNREVRDVHAALHETGIVYSTIMVHAGWDAPGNRKLTVSSGEHTLRLPVIERKGRADWGHAVALVGYTRDGFIVQNSWGRRWGNKGFALLPYEDFILHVTDVWVAQLGVSVSVDLWDRQNAADTVAGRYRGGRAIPLAEIRPYVVDVGNNGELSDSGDYWTSEADLSRLFKETIPSAARERGWRKKRVMLYLHGGLNSERDAAKRAVAFRDVFLANEIYPLHFMWETGPLETLGSMLGDLFTDADERAQGRLTDFVINAKDRLMELTAAPIGRKLWNEMKENAWRASDHRQGRGAMQLMKKHALEALEAASRPERDTWELHVVAHSAGSILFNRAVGHLCSLGIAFKSLQFFAPAVRIDEFQNSAYRFIRAGHCPRATLYILNEEQERDDSVGPYGNSLLWLVSNAFEDERGTPLLGMNAYLKRRPGMRRNAFNDVIISPAADKPDSATASTTHGGFDNDAATMNSVLYRILGRRPAAAFRPRDLEY